MPCTFIGAMPYGYCRRRPTLTPRKQRRHTRGDADRSRKRHGATDSVNVLYQSEHSCVRHALLRCLWLYRVTGLAHYRQHIYYTCRVQSLNLLSFCNATPLLCTQQTNHSSQDVGIPRHHTQSLKMYRGKMTQCIVVTADIDLLATA